MLVKEMHIDFDVKVQKIKSNNFDTFLEEEKDWLLNIAQLNFLRKHSVKNLNATRKGAEDTTSRYEDFERLLRIKSLNFGINTNYAEAILPQDFYEYRDVEIGYIYNCNGIDKSLVAEKKLHYFVVPLEKDLSGSANLYSDYQINIIGTSSNILFRWSDYNAVIRTNEENYVLKNHLIETVSNTIEVYWEKYGNEYAPNSFIFVTDETSLINIEVILNNNSKTIGFTSKNLLQSTISSDYSKHSNTRLVKSEDLYDLLKHPFGKTIHDSPISTLIQGSVRVYTDNKFIVNKLNLYYLRQPRKISLNLNQSCEIAESRHSQIVDLAVELATAYMNSDTHRNIINQNKINE